MKTKTRKIPDEEYDALANRISRCQALEGGSTYSGPHIWMLDDEFEPTQCMAAIRWMYAENYYGLQMFQVDNAGDAILLVREY